MDAPRLRRAGRRHGRGRSTRGQRSRGDDRPALRGRSRVRGAARRAPSGPRALRRAARARKGIVELLHAAARSHEPWQLKIVGDGPGERRLRRLATHLGIGDRVRFYPFIAERERLARWYASARTVVIPGGYETLGLVALAAAACGAPVVTCATAPSAGLMRAIVRTHEPGDIDGLLTAIERTGGAAGPRRRDAGHAPLVGSRVRRRDAAARTPNRAAAALGSRSPADHQRCRRSRDVLRSARVLITKNGR